jgi:tetratricopeptide (TPR) repeat protein
LNGSFDFFFFSSNLAGLYLDWSKYEQAKPIYARALQIYETVFGCNHPQYAQTLHSMAGLAQEQGHYEEAKHLYNQTIAIREKLLGPMHPDLALTFNGICFLMIQFMFFACWFLSLSLSFSLYDLKNQSLN